jgi:flagellar hook-associated protein 2
MSDVYMPGVKSRFDSEKLIDGLMKIESVPKERAERNVEKLAAEKSYWQEVGRRINSLRESARSLYSFQNPFNEKIALSSDESAIGASASREADEQEYSFTVKQVARADRFLSRPLDEKHKIENGTYTFSVGKDEISFNFRGGTLKEFVDALNRRGQEKIGARLMTVQPGTTSLLIESKITGSENRLGFSADAAGLSVNLGMAEQGNDSRRDLAISENTVRENQGIRPGGTMSVSDGVVEARAGASASIPFALSVPPDSPLVLKLETSTRVTPFFMAEIPQPPPGPSVPSPGSISYGGIVIESDPSRAPLPSWKPPPVPEQVNTLNVLSLSFSDGTKVTLPAISDSADFSSRQFNLADIAQGRTIAALNIENSNTHRDVLLRGLEVFDPNAIGEGLRPLNAVSRAQDAVISMEGIEMTRPSNVIKDIIPGVTVTVKGVSDSPVNLEIRPDRQAVKDSIINLVGNYNRLMAEINVLTARSLPSAGLATNVDDTILNELSYLTAEERVEMRNRLGAFSGDITLTQFRNRLQQAANAPYPTSLERDLVMLIQIGIGTNLRNSNAAGYDPSRLRGYLQIDEKVLDEALETKMPAIRQLFASDTTGDLLMDTGMAVSLEAASKPFVETGGLISLKTGTIDSRISQDKRRIENMERQLASKEAELKIQYGRMEAAYGRMEQMTSSLDNFNRGNSNR